MEMLAGLWVVLWIQQGDPAGLREENFRRHIEHLASDEMKGRDNGTPEGRRAAAYVASEMKRIGLEPAGTRDFFHEFELSRSAKGAPCRGINVVGRLPGADPDRGGEIIVVNAHHDARGVIRERIQNGADDNASGVAMILGLAEAFRALDPPPMRTILFVSFDAEEDGLIGSQAFLRDRVADPKRMIANLCFDLIGGGSFPWEEDRVYALGSELSPEIGKAVEEGIVRTTNLEIARLSASLIEPWPGAARSDYGSFRSRGIPFLFFTTGTPWYYHTEWDDPGVIRYDTLVRAGRFCLGVLRDLSGSSPVPTWAKKVPDVLDRDLRLLRRELTRLLQEGAGLTLSKESRAEIGSVSEELSRRIEAGGVGEEEKICAQRAVILLFRAAAGAKPR